MRRIFEAAGVDYVQWRALSRAYVWMDHAALFGAYGVAERRRAVIRLLVSWGFLSSVGLALGMVVWFAADPHFAALSVVTMMMLWASMLVATQPATLAAPEDYGIIGFRPVTSRTYFAVRVAALLWQIFETVAMLGWAPVLAFLIRQDGSVILAAAAAAAIAAATLATTMAIIVVYGWLIRVVSPARVTRALAYVGAALSFGFTAVLMFGMNRYAESDTPLAWMETVVPRDLSSLWFPGTWFASYVPLAAGTGTSSDVVSAGLSVVLLVGCGFALRGRLSIAYASRINALGALPAADHAAPGRDWRILRGETRAVVLLVVSQLRGDARFQLNMASNVAMGVLFSVMGTGFEWPADPLGGGPISGASMPLFALFFTPFQIYQTLIGTPEHQASWMFFVAPANRYRIVIMARDTVAIAVLGPLVALLALFYFVSYEHAPHALLQATFVGAIGYAALQGCVLLEPRLPFSMPVGGAPMSSFATTLAVLIVGMPLAAVLQYFAYRSGIWLAAGFAVVGAINYGLHALTRWRIARGGGMPAYIQ